MIKELALDSERIEAYLKETETIITQYLGDLGSINKVQEYVNLNAQLINNLVDSYNRLEGNEETVH
jgi:hypothetical protein